LIVNGFSVVAAFAAVLRMALGVAVLVAGARAIRSSRHARDPGAGEERFYLLVTLCATLAGLSLVSWPLLYLVLQSYVPGSGGPQWPGVMCIQGVTRIGTGSEGAAALLPRLIGTLAVTKPLLVLVSGAWLVLHLANRLDPTGALTGRVLATLVLAATLAVADGAMETAYLLIPKQEKFLASGCCAVHPAEAAQPSPPAPPPIAPRTLTIAFLGVGSGIVLALSAAIRHRKGPWLWISLLGAIVSLPLGLAFLGDVAAPAFLHLPYHHCVYCLMRRMPETIVGIALYVVGAFGVVWAFAARALGGRGGTGERVPLALLRMARFGYLGSLLMAGVMLVSA